MQKQTIQLWKCAISSQAIINDSIGAFKPCRIHRLYELNSHERHYKVIITTGKLDIFFKHRVSELGCVSEKNVSAAMDADKTKDKKFK